MAQADGPLQALLYYAAKDRVVAISKTRRSLIRRPGAGREQLQLQEV